MLSAITHEKQTKLRIFTSHPVAVLKNRSNYEVTISCPWGVSKRDQLLIHVARCQITDTGVLVWLLVSQICSYLD